MKVQKLRKYLMSGEVSLYGMLEKQLERLGYSPIVKYEKKTYRYKKYRSAALSKKGSYGNKQKANIRPLPDDVVVYEEPQYLYAEGKLPVLLVAHTDIAHSREPSQIFFDQEAGVMWSPEGLGADDRAGVFAVMELAARFNVGVLFCSGEESGGTGVSSFCEDFPENPDYKMVIELDRCGIDDCVFYDNESKDFQNWVEVFGFKKTHGSFSDISILGPAWRINAANLSVGYEEEHTTQEHLFIRELYATIEKVSNMLNAYIPEFEYKESSWGSRIYGGYGRSYGYGGMEPFDKYASQNDKDYCDFCGVLAVLEVVEGSYLCDRCFQANAFVCLGCSMPAFKNFNTEGTEQEQLCEGCVDKYFIKDAGKGKKEKYYLSSNVANEKERGYCDGCGGHRFVQLFHENHLCEVCRELMEVEIDYGVNVDAIPEDKKDDGGCAK